MASTEHGKGSVPVDGPGGEAGAGLIVVRQADGTEAHKAVEKELPSFLILDDGSFAQRTHSDFAEEIVEWDQGKILYEDLDALPKRSQSVPDLGDDEFAEAMAGAASLDQARSAGPTRFDTAYNWMGPLLGKMPYWLWQAGTIPDFAGAYAVNRPVPSVGWLTWKPVFCAGVGNLLLRRVLKQVPTYGSALYDGGLVAYWSYFQNYLKPFSIDQVHRGCLLIRRFRNASDQGHVAWALGGADDPVVQSFWSHGDHLPGLNAAVTARQSNVAPSGNFYECIVDATDFINYRGDEFAVA